MLRLSALACLLALSGCVTSVGVPRPARTPVQELGGRWSGWADQWDSGDVSAPADSRWSVEITIRTGPDAPAGTVSYPSLGCSGRLTYIGGGGNGSHLFREEIEVGADRCASPGTITLQPSGGDAMLYTARHDRYPYVAKGRLTAG